MKYYLFLDEVNLDKLLGSGNLIKEMVDLARSKHIFNRTFIITDGKMREFKRVAFRVDVVDPDKRYN